MNQITAFLNRYQQTDQETMGHITFYDDKGAELFRCCTLELPWKANRRQISCIPLGNYSVRHCAPTTKFPYEHYLVLSVPDRDGIKFHRGCFTKDTLGCILVGMNVADLNKDGVADLASSKIALQRIVEIVGTKGFELRIS